MSRPSVEERVAAGIALLEATWPGCLDDIEPSAASMTRRPCVLELASAMHYRQAVAALGLDTNDQQAAHGFSWYTGEWEAYGHPVDSEWRDALAERRAAARRLS